MGKVANYSYSYIMHAQEKLEGLSDPPLLVVI